MLTILDARILREILSFQNIRFESDLVFCPRLSSRTWRRIL